jgi:hypothetical protein
MKHFEYMLNEKSVFDELTVLRRLPVSMRVDLTLAVHATKTEKLKAVFEGLDKHFVAELILLLRPFVMKVGETIVVSNVVPDQVFIVNTGYLQVSRPMYGGKGEYVVSGLMHDGNVIGLSNAFRSKKMDYKLCSPVKTDMWFVETHELKMVLEYYDDDTDSLIETSDDLDIVAAECWSSKIIEIGGVKVREKIMVDGKSVNATEVDKNLLAGSAAMSEAGPKKAKTSGLVRTIKLDPADPLKEIESLETPAAILDRRILDPGTKRKTTWDVAVGLLIIFSVFIVPLRLGFDMTTTPTWATIDWATDIIFLCDIIVTFRSGYLDDNNVLVTIPNRIVKRYLSLWFWIDLGSTVPIDKIVEKLSSGGGGLRSLKLIRIVRLVRLLKLVKLLKIDMSAVEEVIEIDQTVQKTLRLFAMLYGLAHFFGCFWNMTTSVEPVVLNENVTLYADDTSLGLARDYVTALYVRAKRARRRARSPESGSSVFQEWLAQRRARSPDKKICDRSGFQEGLTKIQSAAEAGYRWGLSGGDPPPVKPFPRAPQSMCSAAQPPPLRPN